MKQKKYTLKDLKTDVKFLFPIFFFIFTSWLTYCIMYTIIK